MSPEAQRIAIAEACGWTARRWEDRKHRKCVGWLPPGSDEASSQFALLPDYLSDLNAMHEAEKVLDKQDFTLARKYHCNLCDVVSRLTSDEWEAVFATSAQRAEAFLRTLGKWEDGK